MTSQQHNAYNAGYNQPGDPPAGQPYAYPHYPSHSTTNALISEPKIIMDRPRQTDWTIPAILATVFCFFPTGICAIIAAVKARSAYSTGDYVGEKSGMTWARRLTLTSIAVGILTIILCVVLYVVLVANTVSTLDKIKNNPNTVFKADDFGDSILDRLPNSIGV